MRAVPCRRSRDIADRLEHPVPALAPRRDHQKVQRHQGQSNKEKVSFWTSFEPFFFSCMRADKAFFFFCELVCLSPATRKSETANSDGAKPAAALLVLAMRHTRCLSQRRLRRSRPTVVRTRPITPRPFEDGGRLWGRVVCDPRPTTDIRFVAMRAN